MGFGKKILVKYFIEVKATCNTKYLLCSISSFISIISYNRYIVIIFAVTKNAKWGGRTFSPLRCNLEKRMKFNAPISSRFLIEVSRTSSNLYPSNSEQRLINNRAIIVTRPPNIIAHLSSFLDSNTWRESRADTTHAFCRKLFRPNDFGNSARYIYVAHLFIFLKSNGATLSPIFFLPQKFARTIWRR